MKLIVGLGNPGNEYENSRHNIGFKAIDALIHKHGIELNHKKFAGIYYKNEELIIAKPLTFMNLSGDFVRAISKYFKIMPQDILIIYDDMDLPVGEIKMKPKGSAAGQKGMKDIILKLETDEIPRLKIGIGRAKNNSINHVLGPFTLLQIKKLDEIKEDIVESIETFINKDINAAMLRANNKKQKNTA